MAAVPAKRQASLSSITVEDIQPGEVVRCDWVELQSRIFRIWQRRYMMLAGDVVLFFHPGRQGSQTGKLALSIPCSQIRNVLGPEGDACILRLQTGAQTGHSVRCHIATRAIDWKKDILYRACKKDK